jgi:hypothetical protein
MQCPRCHAENRDGRRFCGECGLSLALPCPSCGFVNEGSEKFYGGCHAGLGNLYRRTGKGEEAREHLITATTMYREMDMRFWLEQAEAGRDT